MKLNLIEKNKVYHSFQRYHNDTVQILYRGKQNRFHLNTYITQILIVNIVNVTMHKRYRYVVSCHTLLANQYYVLYVKNMNLFKKWNI